MSTATMIDHAPYLERAFELEVAEGDERLAGVAGEIPPFVRGTCYVNGPARFRRGELRYRHWLDGDGMVAALTFDGDGVRFRNRFVRSRKLTAEEEAGRPLFRTFGTAFPGDRLMRGIGLESPVNVSVFPFGDVLLAFGEQGLPWALDPHTLETLGEHTFGGRLNLISPFSAHPSFDPESGEMVNFGVSFAGRSPSLTLYRVSAAGELLQRRRLPLELPASMHDFGLSRRYAVFYLSPYLLAVEKLLRDGATVMEALHWRPELGSRLLVVRRDDFELQASIPIGRRYCLHHVNSFEEDGRLHVDVVELERPVYGEYQVIPELFTDAPRGRPVRLVIDLERWRLCDRHELPYDAAPDFPAIDPRRAGRPYRHLWLLGISHAGEPGRKFFDQLVHLDWRHPERRDVYQAPAGSYLASEPAFAGDPSAAEGGVVIVKRFDAARVHDDYLLFDARDVASGPIATLPLRRAVPAGFHATFAAGTAGRSTS